MRVLAGARVVGIGTDSLRVVDHGGKDEHSKSEKDDEQEELIGAGAEGVPQYAQPHEVSGQLEDPEDPDETHHSEEPEDVLCLWRRQPAQAHLQVKGQDGHKVDDVEGVFDELLFVWTEGDTHEELKGEPYHTHTLYVG